MVIQQEEAFNIKSSYFLWHINELHLRYSDFCHALNLLEKYGISRTPAESGRTLGCLVDNYLRKTNRLLNEVDLSWLAAKYIAYQAKQDLQQRLHLKIDFSVVGERALVKIVLPAHSLKQLATIAQQQTQKLTVNDFLNSFKPPTRLILETNDFGAYFSKAQKTSDSLDNDQQQERRLVQGW